MLKYKCIFCLGKHLITTLDVCMSANAEVTSVAAVMGLDVTKFESLSDGLKPTCQKIKQLLASIATM